jgi:hypothetical protein
VSVHPQLPTLNQEFRLLLASSARPGAPAVGRRGGAPPPLYQELRRWGA